MSEIKSYFENSSIQPFYSSGKVGLTQDRELICTPFGEDVIITDFHTGKQIERIEGDSEIITTLSVSPDGKYLVTCSRSLQIKFFYLKPKLQKIRSVKGHDAPIIVMETDETSTLVATGGAEGIIKVWDLEGGYTTHNLKGHGGIISCLKFWGEKGGSTWRLASAADDCKIRIWDLVSRKCLAVLDNHVSVIRSIDFSFDASILLTAGRDKIINIWDLKSFKLKRTIPVFEAIEAAGFLCLDSNLIKDSHSNSNSNSDLIAYTGGEKGKLLLWNIDSGQQIIMDKFNKDLEKNLDASAESNIQDDTKPQITQIIYYPKINSDKLLVVFSDQTFWDVSATNSSLDIIRQIAGHNAEIIDCTFVLKDRLAIANNSSEVRVLHPTNTEFGFNVLEGHTDVVISLSSSIDGNWLGSAGKDNTAIVWSLQTVNDNIISRLHAKFKGHTSSIGAVALPRSPSGYNQDSSPKFIITGSRDLTIKLWSVPSTSDNSSPSHYHEISKAAYTRKAHDKDINAIDIAPDDQTFATASQDKTVKIWNINTGESIGILSGHRRGVWSVCYSQFERIIATASGDKTVKLWSLSDYSCIKTFQGHTNSVLKAIFISKGKQIASAGGEGLIKIWNKKTGECDATLDGHEDKVWSLTVNESDTVLVSGGGDSVINFWKDVTAEKNRENDLQHALLFEKEQSLSNYIFHRDWKNAIDMAINLDHPMKLYNLFLEVSKNTDSDKKEQSITGLIEVDKIIANLSKDKLEILLMRVKDWNTNAKTYGVAQRILNVILKCYSAEEISEFTDVKKTLDALISYSERHRERIDRLTQDSYLIDFTLNEMDRILS